MSDKEIEKRKKKKMEKNKEQDDPKTKVKEFAKAILECNEYKNFIKCNEELQKNQTAQTLLREFQEKQMELQWNGFNPRTLEELRDLQMKLRKNDTLNSFFNSQQEILELLKRSNNIISVRIGQQFAQGRGGGCC